MQNATVISKANALFSSEAVELYIAAVNSGRSVIALTSDEQAYLTATYNTTNYDELICDTMDSTNNNVSYYETLDILLNVQSKATQVAAYFASINYNCEC